MLKSRNEVELEDRWNVEAMYPDMEAWENEYAVVTPQLPTVLSYEGRLGEGIDVLKSALDFILELERRLSKLYTYAFLRHNEDVADDQCKSYYQKILSAYYDFQEKTSWFEPELLSLSNEKIKEILDAPELKDYYFYLEKILCMKKHTLSSDKEQLIALAAKALQAPVSAFGAMNDADFKFGSVEDKNAEEHELTHGSFSLFLRDRDRTLRKNAYHQLHGKFKEFENTLCELLHGHVQKHLFNARSRNFDSCVEAALVPNHIDTSVYHSLIQAVNENIGTLHKYIRLREKVLNIGPIHLYDMYVPLTQEVEINMSYKEAEALVIESASPLGSEYQNLLKKGLQEQRWVDRFENRNKRSGAFSSGCYDSPPYILMNYKGVLRDVFTLAHEAGHSMHSLLSRENQPYQYSDYTIFVAEVASTFNEDLLFQLLLERARSEEEKIFLINEKIEDIRATLFRQTMFAEFELAVHTLAEQLIPLTPKKLNETFQELNRKYFGESVVIDDVSVVEWARIPHFYSNFYVYQYATGISAALALSERVQKGGDREREDYLSFLKAGSSRYPIDILNSAGVDMRTSKPIEAAIQKFGSLVDQLENSLNLALD